MCSICNQIPCHPNCPNYKPPQASFYCSECGDGIYAGEDYIENEIGEYMHYDCIQGTDHLLKWLGYQVHYMTDDYIGEDDYY